MASVERAKVVNDSIQVILGRDSLRFAISFHVLPDVQVLHGEVNVLIYFFLLANLSIGEVKQAGAACIRRLFALEPFDLDHKNLRYFKQLKFFVDIPVFLALAAIPLVCA